MKIKEFDVASMKRTWQAFQHGTGLSGVRTARDYRRAVALMNGLVDVVGEDESHPLAGLLDLVGELVSAYEGRVQPVPDAPPNEVLRLLMEQGGLTQADLRQELGGQPVVSAVLSGKRMINARQAKALAMRFNLSPAVFL